MPENPKTVRRRPLVIYTVTLAFILTAVVASPVALLGIAIIADSIAESPALSICLGAPVALSGIGATALFLWLGLLHLQALCL